jgi:hypothetical protein
MTVFITLEQMAVCKITTVYYSRTKVIGRTMTVLIYMEPTVL